MDFENLKTLEELKEIVEGLKREGKKIVLTNGCYDIIHKGHIHILREMAKLGDVFIVAINSDDSVRKFKGYPRPYNNERDRASVVEGIKGVDYVLIFGEDDPLEVIRVLRPEVHVKGGAGICERVRAERELVESYGGEMVCLDLMEGYSSTDVVDRIRGLENLTYSLKKEEALDLLEKYKIKEKVLRHSLAVNKFAISLAKGLINKGKNINLELVDNSSLLHDIGRSVIDKTGKHHSIEGYDILVNEGYPDIAEIVKKHGIDWIENNKLNTIEEKIVWYSDKRVHEDRVVSLDERLRLLETRYPGLNILIKNIRPKIIEIENELLE